jgi:hypothetical protein
MPAIAGAGQYVKDQPQAQEVRMLRYIVTTTLLAMSATNLIADEISSVAALRDLASDVPVEATAADWLAGRDRVLEVARETVGLL